MLTRGKRIVLISLILLAAVGIPDAAHACSCDRLAACQTFWTSDVVFIGRAHRVLKTPGGAQEARIVVDEWLRGQRVGAELTIFSYGVGASCDYGFTEGTRYLVHATKRPAGTWGASLCGGTAPVAEATADLKYIRDALEHSGDGTLSGYAFVDINPREGVQTGPPISDARLVLRSSRGELTARTGKEGNYRFEAVPAGEYTLVVELPPGHKPVPPKRIVMGKGACLRHVFWTVKRIERVNH
jgi:hypothetical protein